MQVKLLGSLEEALAYYVAINAALAYPKIGRRPDGSVARESDGSLRGVTRFYVKPAKNPDADAWAVEVDPVSLSVPELDWSDIVARDISGWTSIDTSGVDPVVVDPEAEPDT